MLKQKFGYQISDLKGTVKEKFAQTYFYAKTCSARLGLDWTGWGIKGFATLANLSSFLSCIVSTRSSIYFRYIYKDLDRVFREFSLESLVYRVEFRELSLES